MVEGIAASRDGRKLFVVGAISNEPASSIWEYDVDSRSLRCLVSGVDHPSSHATSVQSHQLTIKWDPGRQFRYHVFEPVGLNPHARKKYPLVIGDTLIKTLDPAYQNRAHGPYWAPMLANAGGYVVIVERPGAWWNEMEHWEEYVEWVYNKMLENPTIDPRQVYLFATSAETQRLSQFVKKRPERWKGLILLSPTEMPDLESLSASKVPPKMLVDQGALEGTNRVHDYQLAAIGHGVRVEYRIHENNDHIILGKKAMGERAENMMDFVFGD
jgi:hypothetical protein